MTGLGEVLLTAGLVVIGSMTLLWLISVAMRDASIVDIFWGPGFVAVAWTTYVTADGFDTRRLLLAALTTLWGLRLGIYLAWRNLGKGEDFRYQAFRRRWGPRYWLISFFQVFLLQGVLLWVVSLPVQAGMVSKGPASLGWLAGIGIGLWAIGFFFETAGDLQLTRFKADPTNRGKVMNRGLWRYTRHPNYFGDFMVWWGIYFIALEADGTWWTVVGPVVMSTLLLRVSGVAMLERSLAKRREGYADYVRRTSAFFPRPPKKT